MQMVYMLNNTVFNFKVPTSSVLKTRTTAKEPSNVQSSMEQHSHHTIQSSKVVFSATDSIRDQILNDLALLDHLCLYSAIKLSDSEEDICLVSQSH